MKKSIEDLLACVDTIIEDDRKMLAHNAKAQNNSGENYFRGRVEAMSGIHNELKKILEGK